MKEHKERKEAKFIVTVTNVPSQEAIQDFAGQMIKIYNEIVAKEASKQETA